jgi:hypothetical protein
MPNWPRNRDRDEAQKVRRAQLIAKHRHTPEMIPHPQIPMVLRAAGIRSEIHPNDVVGFIYKSRAEARDWAMNNRKYHNSDSYGPYTLEGFGCVGIIDLRNQLVEAGGSATDPKLPDNVPIPPRKPRPSQNGKKS